MQIVCIMLIFIFDTAALCWRVRKQTYTSPFIFIKTFYFMWRQKSLPATPLNSMVSSDIVFLLVSLRQHFYMTGMLWAFIFRFENLIWWYLLIVRSFIHLCMCKENNCICSRKKNKNSRCICMISFYRCTFVKRKGLQFRHSLMVLFVRDFDHPSTKRMWLILNKIDLKGT